MTFFIESLGCAKNQVDSEYLIANLEARGFRWVENPEAARIIIVNTCGFIDSARAESLDAIGEALSANGRVIVKWKGSLTSFSDAVGMVLDIAVKGRERTNTAEPRIVATAPRGRMTKRSAVMEPALGLGSSTAAWAIT